MKKTKRVPRKIGGDDNEDGQNDVQMSNADAEHDNSPTVVVKRPTFSSRAKKFSSPSVSRTSFGSAADGGEEETSGGGDTSVIRPRKKTSTIHRDALQRNASRLQVPTDRLNGADVDSRPSYSSTYLDELRNSTPSGPVNPYSHTGSPSPPPPFTSQQEQEEEEELGVVSTAAARIHIPTEAEIREKKDRRRRLAAESRAEEYISLDAEGASQPSSDGDDQDARSHSLIQHATLKPSKDKTAGRLEHEDEDIAEGFEAFVEDAGRVAVNRSERKAQERERRREIARQIKDASSASSNSSPSDDDGGGGDGDGDTGRRHKRDDETIRRRAYDASQTEKGLYGFSSAASRENATREARRQRLLRPPPVRPIPDLKVVLARFNHAVKEKEEKRAHAQKRLEQLQKERREIGIEEERIKVLLKEAGEKLEKLTASHSRHDENENENGEGEGQGEGKGTRGLDSLATLSNVPPVAIAAAAAAAPTFAPTTLPRDDSSEDEVDEVDEAFPQPRGFLGRATNNGVDEDEDNYY